MQGRAARFFQKVGVLRTISGPYGSRWLGAGGRSVPDWTDPFGRGILKVVAPVLGKQLVIVGGCLVVLGAILWWWQPSRGGLPGDIVVERPGFSFHFPIVTCLVLSLILTAILRWLNR